MAEVDLKRCPLCGAKYSAEKFTKNTVQLMKGTLRDSLGPHD